MTPADVGAFACKEKICLTYKGWIPTNGNPKAIVIYLHGAMVSSGDAVSVAEAVVAAGFALYCYDQRGWGPDWKGTVGHLEGRWDYIEDCKAFIGLVKDKFPSKPLCLVGHSMGGLIASAVLSKYQDQFVAAALVCPWMKTKASVPWILHKIGGALKHITPTLQQKSAIPPEHLSTMPDVHKRIEKEREERIRTTVGTIGWFFHIEALQKLSPDFAQSIRLPIAVFQVTNDKVVCPTAIKTFYDQIGSADKHFYAIVEGEHEPHNDIHSAVFFKDLVAFLQRYT